MQQEQSRKNARRKEQIKALCTKKQLAKLKPSNAAIVSVGSYIIFSDLITLSIVHEMESTAYWFIIQMVTGAFLIGYAVFLQYASYWNKQFSDWVVGLGWLLVIIFCLPIDMIWQCHAFMPTFSIVALALAHLAITLWALPLYWGIITISLAVGVLMAMSPPILDSTFCAVAVRR